MAAFLRAIDIFDKFADDELRVRTRSGAFLSILLTVFGGIFMGTTIFRFLQPKVRRRISLTPSMIDQQDRINISLSIEVGLPCYFLHFDAIDSLGYSQLEINSTATLRRLSPNGTFLGVVSETIGGVCHPWHGLFPPPASSNSCEQLILLFTFRGLTPDPDNWPQCHAPASVSPAERCLVKGRVAVNRAAGGFHIAPGRNVADGETHAHDLQFDFPNLRLAHKIRRIRFGPDIPAAKRPLTGFVAAAAEAPTAFTYRLVATPLRWRRRGADVASGFEYGALVASREPAGPGVPPGIWVEYEFTPYGVVADVGFRSPAKLATSAFGFLSGGFAIVMMVDMFIQRFAENRRVR
jgi:hypothetical protein